MSMDFNQRNAPEIVRGYIKLCRITATVATALADNAAEAVNFVDVGDLTTLAALIRELDEERIRSVTSPDAT